MNFIHIHGDAKCLNDVLFRCMRHGRFQPEYASKLSEFSIGRANTSRNPYAGMTVRITEAAAREDLVLTNPTEIGEFCYETPGVLTTEIDRVLGEKPLDEKSLSDLFHRVAFHRDAYDLRQYAVTVRGKFHVVGFVPVSHSDGFLTCLNGCCVQTEVHPANHDPRVVPPTTLKNNRFVKPFEMFTTMYGLPSYDDMDPTPFVAYTYTLLFGMMFGDLGHGFCAVLAGVFLWRKLGMALGRIMTRIGAVSMVFGFMYGSVFGFEHLLDPLFHAMGFAEKPIEVMHPDTTGKILIAAIAVGATLILVSIAFNILIGIRKKDWPRVFLSSNGVCAFIFYAAALLAALSMTMGRSALSLPYVLLLLATPLLVIFFHEPIHRYAHLVAKDVVINQDEDLVKNTILEQHDADITLLFHSRFITARFGRIPTDSYQKLVFYQNEPFMLYPVKTENEYIWLVYSCAATDKQEIDAIFTDLFFERIFIPEEMLGSAQRTAAFILRCVEVGGTPSEVQPFQKEYAAPITPHRTVYERVFPEGFGNFFMETFFEMFEILLSFISNTMSFLRVGGFILVHAGMMSVVMTLAEMVGAGANILVIIIGNLFVMVLEGMIVGIQVLRLEFYEMFSRFYEAGGDPFEPAIPSHIQTESEKAAP